MNIAHFFYLIDYSMSCFRFRSLCLGDSRFSWEVEINFDPFSDAHPFLSSVVVQI